MIDSAYIGTNGYLLEILLNKYKLLDHFNALRRYLLLGQGDFIRHLMDLMEYEFFNSKFHAEKVAILGKN
jgi:gamma-tubulin complex component 3